jgi:hypothetical protein
MGDGDAIRRQQIEHGNLARRVEKIETQVGKLPLRIAHTSGGGRGASSLPIYHDVTWLALTGQRPVETFALGWTYDFHFGVWMTPNPPGDATNWFLLSHFELGP